MSIKFQCDCGQTITARDEFAGRKVQCVGCKKVMLVPGQRKAAATLVPPTRTATAPPPPVPEFDDIPQADLDVGEPLIDAALDPEPFASPTRSLPEPTRTARPPARVVRAAYDHPARYRPFREPGSSFLTACLVLFVLLLMGGGGWAYWEFYAKDVPKPPKRVQFVMQPPDLGGDGDLGGPPGAMGRMGGPPGAMGRMGGFPGQMGRMGGFPGQMGRMGGFPGQMGGFPGQMGGFPGQMGGFPPGFMGQMGGFPPGFMGQMGGRPGQPEKPVIVRDGENAAVKALDLVPADAAGFLSYRLADIWKNPETVRIVNLLPKEQLVAITQMESVYGMSLADVERVLLIAHGFSENQLVYVVESSKPFNRDKLLMALGLARPQYHDAGGTKRAFYSLGEGKGAVHFVNDKVILVGLQAGLKGHLDKTPAKTGPLAEAIKLAQGNKPMVGAMTPPAELLAPLLDKLPPDAVAIKQILDVKRIVLTSDEKNIRTSSIELQYGDPAKAALTKSILDTGLFLTGLSCYAARAAMPPDFYQGIRALLDAYSVRQTDGSLHLDIDMKDLDAILKMQNATLKVRQSAAQVTAANNLKQLALAQIMYADANGGNMVPAVVRSKDGRPLRSWRVELLPYLERQDIYAKLKLDEPWDSQHNKPLLADMPKVFELPGKDAPAGKTYFQVFTGPNTLNSGQQMKFPASIVDGTSQTIAIVEAAVPVDWAAPGPDVVIGPQTAPKTVVGQRPQGFLIALCDGSVRLLPKSISEATLRALITPAGGDLVGNDY